MGRNIFPKNDIILHYLKYYQKNDELNLKSYDFLKRVAKNLTDEEKMILSKNEEFSFLRQEINMPEEQVHLDAMKKNHLDSEKIYPLDDEKKIKLEANKKSTFDSEKKNNI